MIDKKAKRLFLKYMENGSSLNSEEVEYIREKGLLREDIAITKKEFIDNLEKILEKISLEEVSNAFLYSLSTRDLDYRYILASYIYARSWLKYDKGKEYKIPKEIRDIMFEHQGTTLLAYFYNKAKEIDQNVPEEEFRYSGPKPQTKESAVILLADSIEAAVRSLDVKDPVKVEQMVRKIVDSKIRDNQLSDANITFKEVEIIVNSFLKTFGAIYHERIKYPGQK